jgi:hypothetical protein
MKDTSRNNTFCIFALCALVLCLRTTVASPANAMHEPFWDQFVAGNDAPVIHLDELATIVANMPSARRPKQIFQGQVDESYIREGITLGVLFAIMISGHVFGKRRDGETVIMQKIYTAHEEAKIILALGHCEARLAIDSLQGEHKVKVLRAIASSSIQKEPAEMPFVQVERQIQQAVQA